MSKKEIYWANSLVGWIDNINIDNFHVYGKWISAEGTKTQEFLELINSNQEEELFIGFWGPENGSEEKYLLGCIEGNKIEFNILVGNGL